MKLTAQQNFETPPLIELLGADLTKRSMPGKARSLPVQVSLSSWVDYQHRPRPDFCPRTACSNFGKGSPRPSLPLHHHAWLVNETYHISDNGGTHLARRFISDAKMWTMSACRWLLANISGVFPFLSRGSNSTLLFSHRILTQEELPDRQARCRGVEPKLSGFWRFTPEYIRSRISSAWPETKKWGGSPNHVH